MTQLSDREIAEAAAEAGISPAELRSALAQQRGGLPAKLQEAQGMMTPNARGQAHAFEETRIVATPNAALAHLRTQLEHASGQKGHQQGEREADIVDSALGVVYRMRAESDGGQGSLVRVDIDASPAKARQTFTTLSLLASTVLFGLAATLLFSTSGAIAVWVLSFAVALPVLLLAQRRTKRAISKAQSHTQRAIVEAQSREVHALDRPQ